MLHLDDNFVPPHTDWRTGILLSCSESDENTGLCVVRCAEAGLAFDALATPTTWLREALQSPLQARLLQLFQSVHASTQLPFLTAANIATWSDGLTHLPVDICPVNGVVAAIRSLVAEIRTEPLRVFVTRAFERRDVTGAFWTMSASARHHHTGAGGLALHTLEVAQDIAGQTSLRDLERDLGIAGALLHDIGKIWSYTPDMFLNAAGLAMGHELLGLSRLESELGELEQAWPDGAYTMRALLSGQSRMRDNRTMPTSLLARIKACDQRSCEQYRANRFAKHTHKPVWVPQPWEDDVAMDMPY